MTKKKSKAVAPIEDIYTIRIAVTNGATGKDYAPGDTITAADFPPAVIKNWLNLDPPVLEIKEVEEVE
jgi:hypothetical protein